MWMLSLIICVGMLRVQEQAVLVEATSTLEVEIFQQSHTLVGILMMVNVKLEVETLRAIMILIR